VIRRLLLVGLLSAVLVTGAAAAPNVSPADHAAISTLLDRFVVAGIARHAPASAYDLSTAALHEGMTRKEWATGNIPVYPYSPRWTHFPWTVSGIVGRTVRVSLLLQPSSKKNGALAFNVDVVKRGGRWLVDAIEPVAAFTPAGQPARISANRDFQAGAAVGTGKSGRISTTWLAVPGVLVVALALVVPAAIIVRNRRRVRRIEAEFSRR
jgi:hypothetical protein